MKKTRKADNSKRGGMRSGPTGAPGGRDARVPKGAKEAGTFSTSDGLATCAREDEPAPLARDASDDGLLAGLPVDERLAVDEALALEKAPLRSAKSVYDHFDLAARYSIAWEVFEEHARRVRGAHALNYVERLANMLLAKSSPADREGPFDRMTVKLAKKICTVLREKKNVEITELAKLSSSAASLRRAASSAETDRLRRELLAVKLTEKVDEAKAKGEIGPHLSARLRRAIREVYGLEMPQERKT